VVDRDDAVTRCRENGLPARFVAVSAGNRHAESLFEGAGTVNLDRVSETRLDPNALLRASRHGLARPRPSVDYPDVSLQHPDRISWEPRRGTARRAT